MPSKARSSRTSIPVENSPVFVFLGGVKLSLLNKTSPNCLGDPILNSTPPNLKIVFSKRFIFFSNSDDCLISGFISSGVCFFLTISFFSLLCIYYCMVQNYIERFNLTIENMERFK